MLLWGQVTNYHLNTGYRQITPFTDQTTRGVICRAPLPRFDLNSSRHGFKRKRTKPLPKDSQKEESFQMNMYMVTLFFLTCETAVCHQRAVSGLKPTVFHEPLQVNSKSGGEGVGGGTWGDGKSQTDEDEKRRYVKRWPSFWGGRVWFQCEVYSTEYPLDQLKQHADCDAHGQTQSREWVDGDNHRADGLTDVRHVLSACHIDTKSKAKVYLEQVTLVPNWLRFDVTAKRDTWFKPLLDPLRGPGWIGNRFLLVSPPPGRDTTVVCGVFFKRVFCLYSPYGTSDSWMVHRIGTRSGMPLTCIKLYFRVFPWARATPASWYILRFTAFCFWPNFTRCPRQSQQMDLVYLTPSQLCSCMCD